jgi:hypothetical protein
MGTKAKRATIKAEAKHSRAALWTIQLAVEAVADSVRQLKALQGRVYRGHRAALWALQMARHHSLQNRDQSFVEHGIGKLAERVDWPATIRLRSRREHLERPLSEIESSVVCGLAGSAFVVASGMLDISEQLDAWYGGLVLIAATAARSAVSSVTVEAHKKRAAKLMDRLDQLCRNERIAWVFAAGSDDPSVAGRTLH